METDESKIKRGSADILIIGAGPAGLTAGLYAARAGKKTIILEGRAASRLSIGYSLENYPGFISIDSRELLEKFREHAQHFGAEIISSDVIDFNLTSEPKYVTTRDLFIEAKTVILATGKPLSKAKMIPGEERLLGAGVSYCATCDGPLYRSHKVIGIGNSDKAAEDILNLHQTGCEAHWILGDLKEINVSEDLMEEIKAKNIPIYLKTVVKEIVGKQKVERVVIQKDGKEKKIEVSGIFIFRDIPTVPLFSKAGIKLDHGQCVSVDRFQKTNLKGVFAAGDVTCGGMQIVSAAGEGCVAAMQAIKYIRKK